MRESIGTRIAKAMGKALGGTQRPTVLRTKLRHKRDMLESVTAVEKRSKAWLKRQQRQLRNLRIKK
jgi:hypothetical protein